MLVDNTVHGDSRVQKSARAAAAAGWEVILLGRSPDRKERTWHIGAAEVRHLPVPRPLMKRRYEFRRAPLRRPLAYPPGPLAGYRRQRMKAWRAELAQRGKALQLEAAQGRPKWSVLAARARLVVPRIAARVLSRWVTLRARQSDALKRRRAELDSPFDRFVLRFWQSLLGDRAWRRLDPHLWDYELAYGKVIDELRPDLIHANDFRMLGVGARATVRARAAGRPVKLVWDAHEFLPGIKPWNDNPRWHPAQCAHEREYAPYADAVLTVSETLADMLAEHHGLRERPDVMLNAPEQAETVSRPDVPDLRDLCGIGPDVPLVVYSGAAAPQRGLDIMIEALPGLAGVHVALVVLKPDGEYVSGLLDRAAELGVADRVHALPYVPYDQVVQFLSAADAGVIPIHHWPNHEIALITKFFEYSHARLPLVVSDVKTMAGVTRSTGQGEVFTAEDVDDYARAVRAVLADPERYRAVYDTPGLLDGWTWESQAEVLDRVYARLLQAGPRPVTELPPGAGQGGPRETEAAEAAL
ncbi:glycosyl transferase family 1 [Actinomadura craniellae]|uniref:Glycosyl transferase family 1 n=1 Tax=Actinomadura craniellae TaxID=2231787 RepID=A0A365H5Y8_9ACTN|nr:glycosyltransferase family 4 protein [Actinomadura craniellae]RAY14497.1 glycosyl transferase family 1 [Actinomadura craniellae]